MWWAACRGYVLEMLLSKVMASSQGRGVQVVCMSATMSGLDALGRWLNALLFMTNFRCVATTLFHDPLLHLVPDPGQGLRWHSLPRLPGAGCHHRRPPPAYPHRSPRPRDLRRPVPLTEHAVFQGAVYVRDDKPGVLSPSTLRTHLQQSVARQACTRLS
jgi:hypothetical protein